MKEVQEEEENKIVSIIKAFSIGKYSTKMYHNKKSEYTTLVPSILTILMILGLFAGAISVLISLFKH